MSILSGGGRTYGFDLDLIKLSSSSSGRSSSSSSSSLSSTVSESSISTKRPRAPRKRPNQSYTEAAALLSTINPSLFSSKNLQKLSKHYRPTLSPLLPSSDLLPPFPVLNESGFLIEDPSPLRQSPIHFEFKLLGPSADKSCVEYHDPGSSECSDCDVESILDEEVGEGIDSIMGNLSMENCESQSSCLGGKSDFGFGLWRKNIRQAIRGAHAGDWWRPMTAVLVRDIIPMFKALPAAEAKKTKTKKKKIEDIKDEPEVISAKTKDPTSSKDVELKSGLGLKLNHEDVVKAWSDRDFPISTESGAPESSADALARLADIDLLPENEGGVREASVQRYKEKRRNRLFSKKIRYQVRKVNADHRPRMKASAIFYQCIIKFYKYFGQV